MMLADGFESWVQAFDHERGGFMSAYPQSAGKAGRGQLIAIFG